LPQYRTHFPLHISTNAFLKPRSRLSAGDDRVVQAQDIHQDCGQHQEQSQPDPPILVELSAVRMFVPVVGHRFTPSMSLTIQNALNRVSMNGSTAEQKDEWKVTKH
jgi:hypothetical protein